MSAKSCILRIHTLIGKTPLIDREALQVSRSDNGWKVEGEWKVKASFLSVLRNVGGLRFMGSGMVVLQKVRIQ